ncbi:Cyclic nucleotide-binding domain-containing protein [Desulfacinum hydrothermale DSM 13146]|uniref:Cyclic nucleotide-binding domain-containing protein n=1 Tax=Desulfacinum hydrothermale DSM 13146 TaxID=1121390 RepID=A0A1W1XFP8_9BACT|nr:cyclic nucleotide-binding domain-containing protein [Desulfacinum hydrothermale]SMC22796.1 Cyclic nucleotide-binding domain-containing protein [Desulfacinum hydrothermale DSM 13146]
MSSSEETTKGSGIPEEGTEHVCELDRNVEILRRVDTFAGLPLERLKVYALLCHRLRIEKGQFLFQQGEPADKAYVVIEGKAQIIRQYEDHSFIVHELHPGDFFGGLALLANVKRLFGVRAAEDLELLSIDRESFRKILRQFPELIEKILDVMIGRIVATEEKLLEYHIHECVIH